MEAILDDCLVLWSETEDDLKTSFNINEKVWKQFLDWSKTEDDLKTSFNIK